MEELSFGMDEYYMSVALGEAKLAYEEGEIPVGAIVVAGKRIIAKAHNQMAKLNDPTAHAEMLALTAAFNFFGGRYLNDCTLYVTLEPCPMCAGATYWGLLGKLVYGASDEKRGYSSVAESILHSKTEVVKGILADECSWIVKDFFKKVRKNG